MLIKSPDAFINSAGQLPSNDVSKHIVGTKHDVKLISVIESQEIEPGKLDNVYHDGTTLCQDY